MFQPCHSCHDVPHQDVDGDGTSTKLEEAFFGKSAGVAGPLKTAGAGPYRIAANLRQILMGFLEKCWENPNI